MVGGEVDRFVDATAEPKVELHLPLGAGIEPDQMPNGMLIPPETVGLDVVIRLGIGWFNIVPLVGYITGCRVYITTCQVNIPDNV